MDYRVVPQFAPGVGFDAHGNPDPGHVLGYVAVKKIDEDHAVEAPCDADGNLLGPWSSPIRIARVR